MAYCPIHPGEHLAEELKELGMSAAELARQLDVRRPHHRNPQRTARHHRRHGLAPRPFLRHDGGILAEPAKPLRDSPAEQKSGKSIKALPTLKRLARVRWITARGSVSGAAFLFDKPARCLDVRQRLQSGKSWGKNREVGHLEHIGTASRATATAVSPTAVHQRCLTLAIPRINRHPQRECIINRQFWERERGLGITVDFNVVGTTRSPSRVSD